MMKAFLLAFLSAVLSGVVILAYKDMVYEGQDAHSSSTVNITNQPPTCTLAASPAVVRRGDDFLLSWASANATGGSISDIGQLADFAGYVRVTGQQQSEKFNSTFAGAGGETHCEVVVLVE